MVHLLAADGHLLSGEPCPLLGLGSNTDVLSRALGKLVQSGVKPLHLAGLFGSALGQGLGTAGKLLRVAGNLLLRLLDVPKGVGNVAGKAVDGFLNGLEVPNIPGGGMDIEVPVGKLAHNLVNVGDIPLDPGHGLLQGPGQVAQLVVRLVVQGQLQPALLERTAVLGDLEDGPQHLVDDIKDQADEGDEGEGKADNGGKVHHGDGPFHAGGVFRTDGGAFLHH